MKKSIVHLFVFDTMSDWEYGYVVAGINNPQFHRTPGSFGVRTVGLTKEPVRTMGGLRVAPDLTLSRLKPGASAMLILPGGSAWDKRKNSEAAQVACDFLAKQTPAAAICGATAGLARLGVLDSVPHTSNSKDYLAATGYQGGAFFRRAPAVKSGCLVTASAMSPLEFAREIFFSLNLYSEATLDAWYKLYKTGNPKYFASLTSSARA
jgi:putative intracellular protease/amidase